MITASPPGLRIVCPRCRADLDAGASAYHCRACGAEYPVIAGIVDLRVAPDPWIGLEEDRAKALRLEEATRGLDFEASVRAYWEMTPTTPRPLAERFIAHVLGAARRSREWLGQLQDAGELPPSPDPSPTRGEGRTTDLVPEVPLSQHGAALRAPDFWERGRVPSGRGEGAVRPGEVVGPPTSDYRLPTLAGGEGHLPWLDLGCGTGDLLAAVPEQWVVGIDIALRWLVIARKRPELRGATERLVCCCAQALPFPDASFARVLSLGLLEHCPDPLAVLEEARRVLAPGGTLELRTVNRFTLLPEPHVGVWGVGQVPRRWADAYVRWRSGQHYLHHRPLSARELACAMRAAGFADVRVEAAALLPSERARLGRAGEALAPLYETVRQLPLLRAGLAWTAPLLEARGRRRAS